MLKLPIKGAIGAAMNTAVRYAVKHAPAIFAGSAIAGVVTTTFMGGKAALKSQELIKAKEAELERPTTVKEKVETCWKTCLPTAIMGGLTISSIIAGHRLSAKRLAVMCGLYTVAEDRIKALQDTMEKELSPQKKQLIEAESTAALADRTTYREEKVIRTGRGTTLTYDSASGRYFYSDRESIRQAENDINSQIIHDRMATLNEFYYAIGLDGVKLGESIGWDTDNLLYVHFGSKLTENNVPCMVIDYVCKPIFY